MLLASLSLLSLAFAELRPSLFYSNPNLGFLAAFILFSLLASFYLSLLGIRSSYKKSLSARDFVFWMNYGLILGLPFATDLYAVDYSITPFRIVFFIKDVIWIIIIAVIILYAVFETLLINKDFFLPVSGENKWWARLHITVLVIFATSIVELVIGVFLFRIQTVLLLITPMVTFYTLGILLLITYRPSFFTYHVVKPMRLIVSHDYSALIDLKSRQFQIGTHPISSLITMSVQSIVEIIQSEEHDGRNQDFERSVLEYGKWKVLFYRHKRNSLVFITTDYTDSLDVMCQSLLDSIDTILSGFADRFGIEVISPVHFERIRKKVISMFPPLSP